MLALRFPIVSPLDFSLGRVAGVATDHSSNLHQAGLTRCPSSDSRGRVGSHDGKYYMFHYRSPADVFFLSRMRFADTVSRRLGFASARLRRAHIVEDFAVLHLEGST